MNRGGRFRCFLLGSDQLGNRAQQLAPMPERRNPDFLQVGICQIREEGETDVVVSEARSVLPETELLEPVRCLLHRANTNFDAALYPRVLQRTCLRGTAPA